MSGRRCGHARWAGLLVALAAVSLPGLVRAQDAELARGIRQVEEGDLEGAVSTLDAVVRRLSSEPSRSKELASAYLHLGVAYAGLDQEKAAGAAFREAIRRDPSVRLDPARHSAKAQRLFTRAAVEMPETTAGEPRPSASKPLGPAHDLLVGFVGVWDGVYQYWSAPDAPAGTTIVVNTNTLEQGGTVLRVETRSEKFMDGKPYSAHGLLSYNAATGKYVNTSVDSFNPKPIIIEGTFDPSTRVFTFITESKDEKGNTQRWRNLMQCHGATTCIASDYVSINGAPEWRQGVTTYTKRTKP